MSAVKKELSQFTTRLRSNGRVNLYNKDYFYRLKWVLPALLIVLSISLASLFYFDLISRAVLLVSSATSLIVLIAYHFVLKRARIAALKGDTIILKGMDDHSTVTSIKSIRRASSFQILGIQITRLIYIVDKKQCSSLVFGSPEGVHVETAALIQHAKKMG